MYQENSPIVSFVNCNNYSLFDNNLNRVNRKLKCVNEYYVPKYDHSAGDHPEEVKMEEINNKVNGQIDHCVNLYSELHKITMFEIESMRKEHVQSVLMQKINILENKKNVCFNKPNNLDEQGINSIREGLAIYKNYDNNLCKDNDKLQIKLIKEQTKFEEKTRHYKFTFTIKHTLSVLSDIKKLVNESQTSVTPILSNNEISQLLVFETSIDKFKNISRSFNEQDLLDLNKLLKNIQIFQDQLLMKLEKEKKKLNMDKFSFISHNNEDKNNNYNLMNDSLKTDQVSNKGNKEINNFTFKIDNTHEEKLNEFNTFKFNIDKENTSNNMDKFSFKISDVENNNESKKKNDFENNYKQFLNNYIRIQKYSKKIENMYSSFLYDDNLKSFRQELIKAINTPVNSISSSSSWYMKDKFDKLNTLLKCQSVKTGNSIVSANSHPSALIFCKDTLAKKIISIGEQVISVKEETAFEVSSIVTELWQVHPDFGILLYARFKQKCPCLIPFNAAKSNDETDEDYYKSLGYNYINGVVETQNKYVNRMTGIIRLFAAIIVTETKSGKALGIGQAWMLLAATVNLVPQLDITAILLHEMLKTTSYYLNQAYGRQFIKILLYIDTNYMKKIDEVTPIGCFGPVQRLKTFISKIILQRHIVKPQGILPYNFW